MTLVSHVNLFVHSMEERDCDSMVVEIDEDTGRSNARMPTPTPSWPPRRDCDTPTPDKFVPPCSEAPKGVCSMYWKTRSCVKRMKCRFLHVRNPERWWNSNGFFAELEQLIVHNVETAWRFIKASPPVPTAVLETIIRTCNNEASSPHVVLPNIIKIAEETFSRMLSSQRCPREHFVLMLKFYAKSHCNTQAFSVAQELTKYGYLLSMELARILLGCYHPPATRLYDLLVWLDNAGLFNSLYNRLPPCFTMDTPVPEVCSYLEMCALHQVKIYHYNTITLVNFFMAHTNCEAVIRVLELSDNPCVISPDQMEFFMLNHPPEKLDHVTNILVNMFPNNDLCVAVSTATWNYVLMKCCTQQRSAKAMEIFHFMSKCSKVIRKKTYLSLMVLHCDQNHPSEVLIVLEHQIHHHGDVSSVPKICQLLLKQQSWETVCHIVMCVINASHKVENRKLRVTFYRTMKHNDGICYWKRQERLVLT
ncbi:uncharacterized protein [Dysidea avara]|uniref:uncharacterized protein n=1 Tax=Dysidea avara TaxID=196820 RepID=UPI00332D2D70